MNLSIMNYEDIITYYKPQTEDEAYIIDEMKEALKELNMLNDSLEALQDEIDTLKKEIKMLEDVSDYLKEENEELNEIITRIEYEASK